MIRTKRNLMITAIALAFLLFSTALISISTILNVIAQDDDGDLLQYEWYGVQGEPASTHFSAGPAPNSPDILWQRTVPGAGDAPVAFDGKLFIAQGDNITALDPFTGDIIYSVVVPSVVSTQSTSTYHIFKIDDGHMGVMSRASSVVTENETLLAAWSFSGLNTADGSLLWSMPPQYGPLRYKFLYVQEEMTIYVSVGNRTGRGGSQDPGAIEAWRLSDPTEAPTLAWTHVGDGCVQEVGFTTYGDGKLFLTDSEPHQTCLDAKTGEVRWVTQLTGAPGYAGSYYNGILYKGLLDNTFVALDGETGQVVWEYKPGGYGFWSSGVGAAYGMVYELNVNGMLYAFNATTGQVVWNYIGPGQNYPGFVNIADGKVYASTGQSALSPLTPETSKSEFSCLDAYTGKVIWQVEEEYCSGPSDYVCIAYGNFYGINLKRSGGVGVPSSSQRKLVCYSSPKDWTNFMGDPQHTATGYGGPVNMTVKWTFKTEGIVRSSPAVVDGKVYIGSYDKNLYCLDAHEGNLVWEFPTGYLVRSSPAVLEGKVYTGADDGFVYCLDADTGQQIWKTSAPGEVVPIMLGTSCEFRGSPIAKDGRVWVGSLDGYMYCLDADNGDVEWKYQASGSIISTPTLVDNDGLYFASVDGFVYKINALTGSEIWKKETPIGLDTAMMGSPAVGDGKVFIGSGASRNAPAQIGQFYCLNAANGEFIWTVDELPGSGNLQPIWSMLYRDGKVYYGDFFHFTCSNASTGEKQWSCFLTREHYGSPAYADGKFYVPSDSFGVYVVDAETGEKTSFLETGRQVQSSPAIWENKLYFGCHDWNVYCVEPTSTGTIYYGSQPSESPGGTVEPEPTEQPTAQPTAQPTEQPSGEPGAPLITTEVAIIATVAVVAVVGLGAFWLLRKRK